MRPWVSTKMNEPQLHSEYDVLQGCKWLAFLSVCQKTALEKIPLLQTAKVPRTPWQSSRWPKPTEQPTLLHWWHPPAPNSYGHACTILTFILPEKIKQHLFLTEISASCVWVQSSPRPTTAPFLSPPTSGSTMAQPSPWDISIAMESEPRFTPQVKKSWCN